MLAVMGLTLGFDTKQRNSFSIKFGVCNKNKILTILFIVNYEKITHFNDEFLVLLWPIISKFFACSNEEKKGECSSPISMLDHLALLPLLERTVTVFTTLYL